AAHSSEGGLCFCVAAQVVEAPGCAEGGLLAARHLSQPALVSVERGFVAPHCAQRRRLDGWRRESTKSGESCFVPACLLIGTCQAVRVSFKARQPCHGDVGGQGRAEGCQR